MQLQPGTEAHGEHAIRRISDMQACYSEVYHYWMRLDQSHKKLCIDI